MNRLKINDIAQMAGVSKTTVSFVINGKGDDKNISLKTQNKIMNIVNNKGYHPNFLAQNLKTGSTKTIAYLVPDFGNPFFAKIGRIIEKKISAMGYQLIVSSTDEDPETEANIFNRLSNRQVDGYISALSNTNLLNIENMIRNNTPIVFFDRYDENVKNNSVIVENKESMKKAVLKLIKYGKQKIGFCTLLTDVRSLNDRLKGYIEALVDEDIFIDTELICNVEPNNINEDVNKHIEFLIEKNVDGIVFTNNQVASAGIMYLNKIYSNKLSDFGIVTFDDLDWFDYMNFKIISIAQPINSIAENIVKTLIEKIDNRLINKKGLILNPIIKERN